MARDWHLTAAAARTALAAVPEPYVPLLAHGTLLVEWFAPRGVDTQQPHRQDELYIVQSGHARFERDDDSVAVGPGDVLFVPAGMAHRFSGMSGDFATWVVFWGPQGGEPA